MKKNNIYIIAALAIPFLPALSSCSDDNISYTQSSNRINFEVSAKPLDTRSGDIVSVSEPIKLEGSEDNRWIIPIVTDGIDLKRYGNETRSTMSDSQTIQTFSAFARRTDSNSAARDYMYNVLVSRNNNWNPDKEYFWPSDGTLHINAFSPYTADPSSEGITSLPTRSSNPEIGFKVPESVDNQFDLLYSQPTDASSSPCPITFNHALTAIRFVSGAQLAPCTIKEIAISGVADTGTLNLESGEWSDISGNVNYSITPNLTLSTAESSEFVEPDTPLSDTDDIMLLLPQTPGESARIYLTIEYNGKTSTLSADISNHTWEQGKTVTYRLSGTPETEFLILDVTGDFTSDYTGKRIPFNVKSYLSSHGEQQPIKWKADLIDESGNTIPLPAWINSYTETGNGSSDCTLLTQVNDVEFKSKSIVTDNLQNTPDINISSGNSRYNLASTSGSSAVENTANSYIINASGKYSFPVVYGNAIKNGADNKSAYTSTSHSSQALKTYINHLGNGITTPYIADNAGCEPYDAVVLWEEQLNTVRNIELSEDKRTISFDVPKNSIREGNTVIALRDKDGNTMWSWHIWVTDYKPEINQYTLPSTSGTTEVWNNYIGYISGGDDVLFPAGEAKIRFTQEDVPDGMVPLSKTVTVTQSNGETTTGKSAVYYQSGRKDPIIGDISYWFDAEHNKITELPLQDNIANSDVIVKEIQNPEQMIVAQHTQRLPYENLWNPTLSRSDNVKSIYDPCPVGYKVTIGNAFHALSLTNPEVKTDNDVFQVISSSSGVNISLHAFGYRESTSGRVAGNSSDMSSARASIWYAIVGSSETFCYVVDIDRQLSTTNPSFHGFNIIPEIE